MKLNRIALAVVFSILLTGFCRQVLAVGKSMPASSVPDEVTKTPQEVLSADRQGPKISFEKVMHDFGEVDPKSTNVCEFKFKNIGDDLLKITNVSKTCGCTPFTLDKKEYVPGESGILKVKYNAGRKQGPVSRRLFVSSNDKSNRKVELIVKAEIVLKVDFEPERLNLSLRKENAGCPAITIRSLDGQKFAVKSFKSRPDCITADVNEARQATEFIIEPKVDIEKLRKELKGRITIGLTHPECDAAIVTFSTLPEFKVTPASIVLFNAEPQKKVHREVWLLNNYNEDFEVESASSREGNIKIIKQEKFDKRYKFELEIVPPVSDRKRFFKDLFSIKIKNGQELDINCRGFYKKTGSTAKSGSEK